MKRILLFAALLFSIHAHAEEGGFKIEKGKGVIKPETPLKSVVFNAGVRWPDPLHIPQCWVNPEAGGDIVADLEAKLTAEYAKAGIAFTFTGKCQGNQFNQVVIRTYLWPTHTWAVNSGGVSAGGGVSFLGAINANLGGDNGPTATMNVQIASDVQGYPTADKWFRQFAIDVTRATAVHEFGHAMGLQHEHERSDGPLCNDQKGGLQNDGTNVFVGPFDPLSIMSYCRDGANVSSLSDGDVMGLKYLYPNVPGNQAVVAPKGSYAIKIKNGQCLSRSSITGFDQNLLAKDCDGSALQAWNVIIDAKKNWVIKDLTSVLCLNLNTGAKADGLPIYADLCRGASNESFHPILRSKGTFYSLQNLASSKCVQYQDGLKQYPCVKNGIDSQEFGFVLTGAKKNSKPVVGK